MQTVDLIGCWSYKGPAFLTMKKQLKYKTLQKTPNLRNKPRQIPTTRSEHLILNCSDAPITQDHLNHARVCNALVTVCAEGLRDILLNKIPPGYSDFYQLLLARKPALTAMRQLRQEQNDIMFPDPRVRYSVRCHTVVLINKNYKFSPTSSNWWDRGGVGGRGGGWYLGHELGYSCAAGASHTHPIDVYWTIEIVYL